MQWFRLAVLIGAAILAMVWLVVRPEHLYVQRIEFSGNVRATVPELRHLADLRNGTTIWGVDPQDLSEKVHRHPWVSSVRVERRLSGTVLVRVTEHEPVALLAFEDGVYYLDATGRPFLRAHSGDLDYPVLTGLDAELERAHPDLPRWVLHDALWLIRELNDRDLIRREQVSEVSFHRARGYAVHTTGSMPGHPTAQVLFGLGDYERQLVHLAALLDKGVDLSQPLHVDVAPQRVAIVRPL
jgi:hypothetical protein